MSIKGYQDLEVWQKAMDLVVMCYQATKNFPKSEVYSLANQLQRAAVSIPANIAEGRERKHKKEFVQHLSIAYSSLAEVETLRAEPVAPFHFTSFARRPSGEFPFTHGQARGTLPFGLLE
ncbi:MAG: four helix bundle protein, partial [Sedimentisphaerales bacterium]